MNANASVGSVADQDRTSERGSGLASLPKAGLGNVLIGARPLFRPGTHRSSLQRLGARFVIDLAGLPALVITRSPDDARAILTDPDGALSLGAMLQRFTPHAALFGEDNVIFLDGEEHLRERRRLAPAFHGQVLVSYERAMVDIVSRRVAEWPTDRPLEFLRLGHQLALDVMMTVIFGVSQHQRMARLEKAMLNYCNVIDGRSFMGLGVLGVATRGRWQAVPQLARAAAAVDRIVFEEITERRGRGGPRSDDCLTMFLDLRESDPTPSSDEKLARELRGLMLAGYETTAITLAWIAEMLVHHPDKLTKLEGTIDDGDDAYLDAVIAEVLRMRPAFAATGRRAIREFDLNGTRVPRGAMLIVAIMAMHEDPELYPRPLQFEPERFLERRPGTYTWLPFGGGVHRCVGAAFALFETRVLMRTLLRHRTLRAVERREEHPRQTHPLLVPDRGARITLGRRR